VLNLHLLSLTGWVLHQVKLADDTSEEERALELRVDDEADEEEGVVEAAHVLQNAGHRVNLSLVEVVGLVYLDILLEVPSLTGPFITISRENNAIRLLVEVVFNRVAEKTNVVILKLYEVFLIVGLINHRPIIF
jgi:hypothetical protein